MTLPTLWEPPKPTGPQVFIQQTDADHVRVEVWNSHALLTGGIEAAELSAITSAVQACAPLEAQQLF
jgi:hypothetical protein